MCASSYSRADLWVVVAPSFNACKLSSSHGRWLITQFNLFSFLINLVQTCWADVRCMTYSCDLRSQQVSLLSWEWRNCLQLRIEITSELVFDHSCNHYLAWLCVWQLHPITEEIVSYPIDVTVDSCTSLFSSFICNCFLFKTKLALHYPIVSAGTEYLSEQLEALGSTLRCQLLERLLHYVYIVFSKINASPLKHLLLLTHVWDLNIVARFHKHLVFLFEACIKALVYQFFGLVKKIESLFIRYNFGGVHFVHHSVLLWVALTITLVLDYVRHFFEFVESVEWVILHNK